MNLGWLTPLKAVIALSALTLLIVALWPLGISADYMNHLARTHIEGEIGSNTALQKHFAVSFDIIPDLTMDMIVPWLKSFLGTYGAGAVTIMLAFLAPPLAGVWLAQTVHGRITWMSLAGFITLFNVNMDWGFINFAASSGLALLAFVLWVRLGSGWKRGLLFLPLGVFLAANHALGFLLFGFLAAVWQIVDLAETKFSRVSRYLVSELPFDVFAAIGGVVYIWLSMQGAADLPRGTADFFSLEQKLYALWAPFEFQNTILALVLSIAAIALVCVALTRRILVFGTKMKWLTLSLLGLVILMPTSVLGIWGLHIRFSNILLIVLFAGAQFAPTVSPDFRRAGTFILALFGAVAFANGAVQMSKTHSRSQSVRAVFSHLPDGAKLLAAQSGDVSDYMFVMNASAMAVIDKSAYVPGLFTNTSPVDIQPEMAALHMPQAQPLKPDYLAQASELDLPPSENGYWSLGYARGWPNHWDYLAYFKNPEQLGLMGFDLCAVQQTPQIILYRIGACAENDHS